MVKKSTPIKFIHVEYITHFIRQLIIFKLTLDQKLAKYIL